MNEKRVRESYQKPRFFGTFMTAHNGFSSTELCSVFKDLQFNREQLGMYIAVNNIVSVLQDLLFGVENDQ